METVFDPRTNQLYVSIRQTFAVWFIPLYKAPVHLVSVLSLTQRPSSSSSTRNSNTSYSEALAGPGQERSRYYITNQNDLYQVNDFVNFLLPGLGPVLWFLWQLYSTGLCVLGSLVFLPLYMVLNKRSNVGSKTKAN